MRCPGPVTNSLWNDEALSRRKFDRLIFEIDQQFSFDHVEKFVIVGVLVPVILTFYHPRRTTDSFTLHSVWLNHL